MIDVNDQEWIAQYQQGDVEALGKLVEHYRRPLFGFIIKMMENTAEAEEIFQEVWFRAIKNLGTYRHKQFLSWLFRIAHNLIIDRSRKRKAEVSLQDQQEDEMTLEEKIQGKGPGIDALVAGHDLGQRIQLAVARLPQKQKEVFLMRTEGELPFKQIAHAQKIPINTALARMQYALNKLREELESDYEALTRSAI